MAIPLSILDVSPIVSGSTSAQALRNSIDLARFADERGYTRYWLAEHHNSPGIASTTPEIMIGQIARETQHIRVGSGGVMLPNHAPLKVAESFKLLEALYPERIDLGIGRAPGTDMRTALALRRSEQALNADDFPEELAQLQAFATGSFPAYHAFTHGRALTGGAARYPRLRHSVPSRGLWGRHPASAPIRLLYSAPLPHQQAGQRRLTRCPLLHACRRGPTLEPPRACPGPSPRSTRSLQNEYYCGVHA